MWRIHNCHELHVSEVRSNKGRRAASTTYLIFLDTRSRLSR